VERLYRTEGGWLWRAVMAYCGDREIANDAVAEVLHTGPRPGEAIRAPLPWLWRSAFRIATGELKARRRPDLATVDPGYEMPEPLADLIGALGRLSPNQRAALILHDYADPTDPRGGPDHGDRVNDRAGPCEPGTPSAGRPLGGSRCVSGMDR
jgi:DNA-directed RNA polymerase specialized sigma24 family protein